MNTVLLFFVISFSSYVFAVKKYEERLDLAVLNKAYVVTKATRMKWPSEATATDKSTNICSAFTFYESLGCKDIIVYINKIEKTIETTAKSTKLNNTVKFVGKSKLSSNTEFRYHGEVLTITITKPGSPDIELTKDTMPKFVYQEHNREFQLIDTDDERKWNVYQTADKKIAWLQVDKEKLNKLTDADNQNINKALRIAANLDDKDPNNDLELVDVDYTKISAEA